MAQIPEPPIHDDDTSPSIVIRPVDLDARIAQAQNETPLWQQAIGWLSLLGALVFTVTTLIILFLPSNNDPVPEIVEVATTEVTSTPPTAIHTEVIPPTAIIIESVSDGLPPVISAQQFVETALESPVTNDSPLLSVLYNPYTVVNTDRARSEFIDYTVVQGDTIDEIAIRYGIEADSIAWCNDRRIVQVLRPSDVLRIPPIDGACHQVFGTREETLSAISEDYNLSDPFIIIDSQYNRNLLPPNVTATDILLGGTNLFIPGGEGEVITWNAGTEERDSSGNLVGVGFANGQPGSCGSVTPTQFVGWGNPLPAGTWVRGFYAGHSGLDLSASTGTPIYAASSGNVLFSGFSRWGYGEAVVIEHGGTYSTLYGHMSQRNVSCGQFVSIGQVIGYVGSTGNSSGPHLHFEIQVNNNAVNPGGTPGIGW